MTVKRADLALEKLVSKGSQAGFEELRTYLQLVMAQHTQQLKRSQFCKPACRPARYSVKHLLKVGLLHRCES